MNPVDQAAHRTKTAQLEARIATLETVTDDLARYLAKWAPAIGGALEQHAALLEQLDQRLTAIETAVPPTLAARMGALVRGAA